MSEVFGNRPRPWILADYIERDSDVGQALLRVSPTVAFLASNQPIDQQVRQTDFDAYVSIGNHRRAAPHLSVLQFGGDGQLDAWEVRSPERRNSTTATRGLMCAGQAGRLTGPDDAAPEVVSSLARSLARHLLGVRPRFVLFSSVHRGFSPMRPITAFVREEDGNPCAGYWHRGNDDGPQWWWLPEDTPERDQWVFAAFAAWRKVDPERFPAPPDWTQDPEWSTASELTARASLEEYRRETATILAQRMEEDHKLRRVVEDERARADSRERRLLTASGDPLKDQVSDVLIELGFAVVDSDALEANQAEKLEDLRVSDGAWTALVEVKGYTKGAKTNDLQKFTRPVGRYVRDTGREPDALWYIVNQEAGSDPGQRRPPLTSNPDDVESFGEDGGLVIDTVELFRLQRSVHLGTISKDAARAMLMPATGIFTFTPPVNAPKTKITKVGNLGSG